MKIFISFINDINIIIIWNFNQVLRNLPQINFYFIKLIIRPNHWIFSIQNFNINNQALFFIIILEPINTMLNTQPRNLMCLLSNSCILLNWNSNSFPSLISPFHWTSFFFLQFMFFIIMHNYIESIDCRIRDKTAFYH